MSLRNPISVRLCKVLGSKFNDDTINEALKTISDLYISSHSETNQQVYSHGNDGYSDELGAEVSSLVTSRSGFEVGENQTGESACKARRNLRRDMELKLTNASEQFLEAFMEIDETLERLQVHVAEMWESCTEAERQVGFAAATSGNLLECAGNLQRERQEIESKISTVTTFLGKFTLDREELESITSSGVPVGQRLFDAIDRSERIRDDCQYLMAEDNGPAQAGIDIMTVTSRHLEQGYDKIFRWCSYEFATAGKENLIDVTPIMQEAVKRLQRRPELLSEALAQLWKTRQSTLLSSFIAALTRGSASGIPRPIELHAHDPLRYVGDMLAWVHQAVAAELEVLEILFQITNRNRMVGSVRVFDEKLEEEEWVMEVLDSCFSKLCVPLKARIQQTIKSQESCIVAYKMANLLQFYMSTLHHTIGEKAVLSGTLLELTNIAFRTFYESISAQASILRLPQEIDGSLTPSLAIREHSQILRDTMTVYQSFLSGTEDENEQMAGFEKILDIMVTPVVETCKNKNSEHQLSLSSWDHHIYILNCLNYIVDLLKPYPFTRSEEVRISTLIEERVLTLTNHYYNKIMDDAGIQRIFETCHRRKPNEPLSRLPATKPKALQEALHKFSKWLSEVEVFESPQFQRLIVQQIRIKINHEALERLALAYEYICGEVKRPDNYYEAATTLLGSERPFGQVHLLRQILGLGK